MDMLVADLDKEMQEMEFEEKDSQAEYAEIVSMEEEKKGTLAEAMAKADYLKDLHLDCDWLLANFEYRKEARAGEVEALKKAKAVLSGADYSLVQVSR